MTKNKESIFKAECEAMSVNKGLGIVFGWGMVTHIDGQPYRDTDNERFPDDLMLKATSEFMASVRTANDMHTPRDIGYVVHGFPLTKEIAKQMGIYSRINGWMVGVKPTPDILQKFIDGEYTGFSIEGKAIMVDE